VRHLRQLGLVGLLALALACCAGPNAAAQETITALCTSGNETQTCNTRWYASPVSVVWRAGPTAPISVSPCALGIQSKYDTDTLASLWCEAEWTEEHAAFGFTLHVETTSPTAEALPERPPDSNGWYNHPVAFTFKGRGYSGTASCIPSDSSATVTYGGPDALSATVGATCTDPAGKSVLASAGLHYDSTPPAITAIPSRPPDFNGWYNHPVTFLFAGTDATAGIETCNTVTYAGPDSASARVVGSCRDRAGNTASLALPVRYQATPPHLDVEADAADASVLVRWRSRAAVEIVRSPGLRGRASSVIYRGSFGGDSAGSGSSLRDVRVRDGVRYTYTVTARDQAGNTTVRTVSIVAGPRLLAPSSEARVTAPPLLRWTPVRGASYYNVQLYRGTKILTLWPARASLRLNRAWRFEKRFHRLTPGRYRWYVWPGFGSRSASRYGSLIGRGQFVVAP
jgi:hypothetical protein